MWFGALCGAVALTRLDEHAYRARQPYRGSLGRRLGKLCFWTLPVLWTMYAMVAWAVICFGSIAPGFSIVFLLILASFLVLQTGKHVKMAIFG